MSDLAIKVEGVSKRYQIGQRVSYRRLTETLTCAFTAPFRKRAAQRGDGYFWALKDVSFEVKPGEVLGIIGRNGAGKSTLLKILSRVTEMTEGTVDLYGRIGSLLEVGTGFHPELTGRENIYLNGAILGMKRPEIRRKFDEIVEFAEVTQFLDTPVKHFSSGMYMRLAFAVAAHLEPEILVVDEVLAVGDAAFQKKCLGKMGEVAKGGRTVLFVSHNLGALRQLCTSAILLDAGRIALTGTANEIVDEYAHRLMLANPAQARLATPHFVLHGVDIAPVDGAAIKTFSDLRITVTFSGKDALGDPGVYLGFLSSGRERLAGLDFKDHASARPRAAGEACTLGFVIQSLPFLPGRYHLEVHLKDMRGPHIDIVEADFSFQVADTPVYGVRRLDSWFGTVGLKATPLADPTPGATVAPTPLTKEGA